MAGESSESPVALGKGEKVRRWLTIIGAVALVIFIVYLLLILIYPSMNIGMST